MLESYHVKVKNDKVLELLKKLFCAIDSEYNKTRFLNLLNYKHLLMTSAQVMELTETELVKCLEEEIILSNSSCNIKL